MKGQPMRLPFYLPFPRPLPVTQGQGIPIFRVPVESPAPGKAGGKSSPYVPSVAPFGS